MSLQVVRVISFVLIGFGLLILFDFIEDGLETGIWTFSFLIGVGLFLIVGGFGTLMFINSFTRSRS